jgi:predicted 3-demethylubiquinone-9 3-methyltransferase (glyoxalase superfamily)
MPYASLRSNFRRAAESGYHGAQTDAAQYSTEGNEAMATTIRPMLMFQGAAEAAMRFYVSLFPDGEIVALDHYGPGEAGTEGSVKTARFVIGGQALLCIDSAVRHDFTFTPSISLFVDCAGEAEIDRLFATLSEHGKVFMPLGQYGFSRRFGWVEDRFGVAWQVNLP